MYVMLMQLPESLVKKFMKLGFKEYEARVFLTLSIIGPATATRIHEFSGVPRPRVYDVLKELNKKGLLEIQPGSPQVFQAPPVDLVINRIKKEIDRTINEVSEELAKIKKSMITENQPYTLTLSGLKSVLTKIQELLLKTKEVAYIGIFEPWILKNLYSIVKTASAQGKKIRIFFIRKDYKKVEKFKKIAELHQLSTKRHSLPVALFTKVYAHALDQMPICMVNTDGKEMLLIFRKNTKEDLLGVWLGIVGLAMIQRYLIDEAIDIS